MMNIEKLTWQETLQVLRTFKRAGIRVVYKKDDPEVDLKTSLKRALKRATTEEIRDKLATVDASRLPSCLGVYLFEYPDLCRVCPTKDECMTTFTANLINNRLPEILAIAGDVEAELDAEDEAASTAPDVAYQAFATLMFTHTPDLRLAPLAYDADRAIVTVKLPASLLRKLADSDAQPILKRIMQDMPTTLGALRAIIEAEAVGYSQMSDEAFMNTWVRALRCTAPPVVRLV